MATASTADRLPITRPLGTWYFIKTSERVVGRGRRRNFTFTLAANGVLIAPDGRYWLARSGPHGKGALPDGVYDLTRPTLRTKRGYKDPNGFGWFCHLPSRHVKLVWDRDEFGIHPDGGPIGTRGCIGLIARDTRPAYNALRSTTAKHLIVRPKGVSDEDVLENLFLKAQGY